MGKSEHLAIRVTPAQKAMIGDLQQAYGLKDHSATVRACIEQAAKDRGLTVDRTSEVKDG